jgi:hypothetical protein
MLLACGRALRERQRMNTLATLATLQAPGPAAYFGFIATSSS